LVFFRKVYEFSINFEGSPWVVLSFIELQTFSNMIVDDQPLTQQPLMIFPPSDTSQAPLYHFKAGHSPAERTVTDANKAQLAVDFASCASKRLRHASIAAVSRPFDRKRAD
jgi:hypothetical protein